MEEGVVDVGLCMAVGIGDVGYMSLASLQVSSNEQSYEYAPAKKICVTVLMCGTLLASLFLTFSSLSVRSMPLTSFIREFSSAGIKASSSVNGRLVVPVIRLNVSGEG